MTTILKLNSVNFAYGEQPVLNDISLTVKTGEIACLLGPSGCGKSTLLRLLAGFEKPDAGEIHIADQLVANQVQSMPPEDRQVGMLFQDLALFPHLNVLENIAFGLHKLDKNQQQNRVDELLQLCRLEAFHSRYPHQLSGGQCQRVALARAMAPKPKLILLDEPFSSVDTGLQSELVHEVKHMLQADQSTALWVTHSLDEAFAVADQMGIVLAGNLLQWAAPDVLYDSPTHPDVVKFLNHANLISGCITNEQTIQTPIGTFELNTNKPFKATETAQVAIHKEYIEIDAHGDHNATVTSAVYQGGHYLITAQISPEDSIQFPHRQAIKTGQKVCLRAALSKPLEVFQAS